jgi:hypothetical protein
LQLFEVKVKQKNDLAELAQLAEQVIECFNAAAGVIEASNLDPEQAKEYRRLWASVYSSACDVLSKIGDICPELDPFSPQRLREHVLDMKIQTHEE